MIWRFRAVLLVFIIAFLTVVARLFYWQVVKADELSKLGAAQYGSFVKIYPKRGEIITSDKFPLVTNKISFRIVANPKSVKNKDLLALKLAEMLDIDKASVSALLSQNLFWVPIKNNISLGDKERFESMNNGPAIGFEEQFSRLYPEASIAAHILGFVGKDKSGS